MNITPDWMMEEAPSDKMDQFTLDNFKNEGMRSFLEN
jgi:hypothetical protein